MHIIGAGRLGSLLGNLLQQHGLITISEICNQSLASSKEAIAKIGAGEVCLNIANLKEEVDIIMIATPDDAIAEVASLLASSLALTNKVIFHLSGARSSSLLQALKEKGAKVASVHLMRSFSKHSKLSNLKDTYVTMEGDVEALTLLAPLFEALQAILIEIPSEKKIHYHLGGVYASNYLVALFELALAHFAHANIAKEDALAMTESLMQATLANLKNARTTRDALTGPLMRGDSQTLAMHLAEMEEHEATLYKSLAKVLLPLTSHTALVRETILAVLSKAPSLEQL